MNISNERTEKIFALTRKIVSIANKLPKDLDFYKVSFPEVRDRVKTLQDRIIALINKVVDSIHEPKQGNSSIIHLRDLEDMIDRYDLIWVQTLDKIVEKVNVNCDLIRRMDTQPNLAISQTIPDERMTKAIKLSDFSKPQDSPRGSPLQSPKLRPVAVERSADIRKPQLDFADKVDNSADTPFIPKLHFKPNSMKPLSQPKALAPNIDSHLRSLGIAPEDKLLYPHPYEFEIENIEYPKFMFDKKDEQLYMPIEQTPFTYIDNVEALEDLALELSRQREFAVDLEAHDYRSYMGITCLMQISTRSNDYIIDTLALRSSLGILNDAFTNPSIVKVLHGADYDIVWLQRDFGLYIVNLFDTFHACAALKFPKKSLAFLIQHFVGHELDKKYQLADWRIRPIPEEMIKYAQEDTHYLLYVYDRLRNDLLTEGDDLLNHVLKKSADTSVRTFKKRVYSEDSFKKALAKFGKHSFSLRELTIFRRVHKWRDDVARLEDESPVYIMPDYIIFGFSTAAPRTPADATYAYRSMPLAVRNKLPDLLIVIQEAISEAEFQIEQNNDIARKLVAEAVADIPQRQHIVFDEEDDLMLDDEIVHVAPINVLEDASGAVDDLDATALEMKEEKLAHSFSANFLGRPESKKNILTYQSRLFSGSKRNQMLDNIIEPPMQSAHFLLRGLIKASEVEDNETEDIEFEIEQVQSSPKASDDLLAPVESSPAREAQQIEANFEDLQDNEMVTLSKLDVLKKRSPISSLKKRKSDHQSVDDLESFFEDTSSTAATSSSNRKNKKKRQTDKQTSSSRKSDSKSKMSLEDLRQLAKVERPRTDSTKQSKKFDPYSKIEIADEVYLFHFLLFLNMDFLLMIYIYMWYSSRKLLYGLN